MIRYLLLLSLLAVTQLAFSQAKLEGKVSDGETGEPIIFGNVALYKNGVQITVTETDLNGDYSISIDPGTYDIEFIYLGYGGKKITGVVVYAGETNRLNASMSTEGLTLEEVVVTEYKVPLIKPDETTQGGILTSEEIRALPTRNINQLAAQTAGVASSDDGDVNIRGSRSDATNYYLDGIRVSGNLIPESEIGQLQVITGGASAQYGDVTGGIISITSKGPSSVYSGGIEVETSEYLDAFDSRLLGINLSGPILKKKSGESILGFRVSGRYTYWGDDDQPAKGVYRVKEEKLAELEAAPIIDIGGTTVAAAESLTADDVELLKSSPYEKRQSLNLTAKLDARLTDNIDVSFTGTYFDNSNRFTPDRTFSSGLRTVGTSSWRLLNAQNNPEQETNRYRGIFRFRHRLGGRDLVEGEGKNSLVRNASYSLYFSYEKDELAVSDYRHRDNLFDYGYVGNFDYTWEPTFGVTEYSGGEEGFDNGNPTGNKLGHTDYAQEFNGYTPVGEDHPNYGLTLYNAFVPVDADLTGTEFIAQNGLDAFHSSETSVLWEELFSNVHSIYNRNRKTEDEVFTFKAESSFELVPGSAEKGKHSISFGVLYEQRNIRAYTINPVELWETGRLLVNNHLQSGLDTTQIIGTVDPSTVDPIPQPDASGFFDPLIQDVDLFNPAINNTGGDQLAFFRRVREATGTGLSEYVNINGLTPDQLSLDMFSAQELHSPGLVSYYGYDYLGNKEENVNFEDFFTATGEDGIRTYPIAPFQPIYTAAYIEDKFSFKDIIVRAGVRVDRYDANRKVLKDPYSLYEIETAGDFYNGRDDRPAGVGDNYKVYTTGESSDVVQAFREGDNWYFPDGALANNGRAIYGGGVVNPRLVDKEADISNSGFDPNTSFEDYEPQINVMPRLAFSFPISQDANFFAHYDVLVQRPTSGTEQTALDYLYFYQGNRLRNNANLKPEQTVDYEIGFQQKLTNSSAVKLAAFYRELRDMIQQRTYLLIPTINDYSTYGNLDFGTVKGFTFQYDLRRTNNLRMTINYTLQFADGTGSDPDSQAGLTREGNPRFLFPLSFDERHRLVINADYRYASGKKYNGPRVFGKDIFANAGLNVVVSGISGRPYTANSNPEELGSSGVIGETNGARLPWQFKVDFRVDKNFTFSRPDAKKSLALNVYVRIQNALDTRNVRQVHQVTGSADDDGYLNSPIGLDQLQSVRDADAYSLAYQWRVLNSDFYTFPRRIYIGASLFF